LRSSWPRCLGIAIGRCSIDAGRLWTAPYAYALVVKNLERLEPDTVLNIASGIPRRISDILEGLVARSRVEISVEQDPARQRPGDLPIMIGDAGRACAVDIPSRGTYLDGAMPMQ
jgi:hypothetical protein